ncbi:MAG: DinB family protein [Coriobacteriia bacterium]|nr:DinB family protein [Coriobacteriia bacterium]
MISPDATPAELLTAYREGPELLRQAIEGLDADALRARPIARKMSSLEVVCHIVDSDQFMCDRIKRTIATDKPLIMGVESADYPGPLAYHERDLELDLRLLEIQREQLAADLARLTPEAWQRTAVHSEGGTVTVYDLFYHAVEHLEAHLAAIADKRAALGI